MTLRLLAFRILSLIAITLCAAMLVDYIQPAPTFCGFRAGCSEVVHSKFGNLLGVPLPVLGLLSFLIFFSLTLFPGSVIQRGLSGLAVLAGLVGLGLVCVQVFLLKQICPMCMAVDAVAILIAVAELGLPPQNSTISEVQISPTRTNRWAWLCLAVVAIASPFAWAAAKPAPEVPSFVKTSWMEGKINVIELTDFTCPHCRQTHGELDAFIDKHKERVNFVRIVVPLERYQNSRSAAKSYLCAERQGEATLMADALFSASDLSSTATRDLAVQLGLDMEQYDIDFGDPALDVQIDSFARGVLDANNGGLPQIWMQDILLIGAQNEKSLSAAFDSVKRADDSK